MGWAGFGGFGWNPPCPTRQFPPWENGVSIWAYQLRAEREVSASEVVFRCFGEPHVFHPDAADAAQADVALSPWLHPVVVIP